MGRDDGGGRPEMMLAWQQSRLVLTLRAELLLQAAEALDAADAVGPNVMQSLDHLLVLVAQRQVSRD